MGWKICSETHLNLAITLLYQSMKHCVARTIILKLNTTTICEMCMSALYCHWQFVLFDNS